MADETPPLDDARLAEIRARAEASWQMLENSNTISVEVALTRDALTLVAEVDRLRAREAAAMAIVRKVATMDFSEWCSWCGADSGQHPKPHASDCPVTVAQTLLAHE